MKHLLKIYATLVFCFVVGGAQHALASEISYEQVPLFGASGDFVVGPGKVEYSIQPGQTRTAELTLTNRLGKTSEFQLSVEDVMGSNDPQQAVRLLGTDRGPYSLRDYISFPESTITLENGERARVPVTITIPDDAEPGGRYGSVLVSVIADESELTNDDGSAAPRSVVISRVGALYFITVPGDVVTAGSLEAFRPTSDQPLFFDGSVDFEVLFKNTGSVHLNPHGEIQVTNMFGDTIERIEIPAWYTMPESTRYLEASLDRTWLFGLYTAELELYRGYDGLSDSATISFIAIPWEVLSVAFGAIFVMIMRVFYLRVARKPHLRVAT